MRLDIKSLIIEDMRTTGHQLVHDRTHGAGWQIVRLYGTAEALLRSRITAL